MRRQVDKQDIPSFWGECASDYPERSEGSRCATRSVPAAIAALAGLACNLVTA